MEDHKIFRAEATRSKTKICDEELRRRRLLEKFKYGFNFFEVMTQDIDEILNDGIAIEGAYSRAEGLLRIYQM